MKLLETLDLCRQEADKVRESVAIRPGGDVSTGGILNSERGHIRMGSIRRTPEYIAALKEAGRLILGVRNGTISEWKLQEAMSTDDFPLLTGDLMYRQLLGNYADIAPVNRAIAQKVTVKDFRELNLYTIDGATEMPASVKELAPYPETQFSEDTYSVRVGKFGRRMAMSFEMLVNDDLNAFQSRPGRMAVGCAYMEDKTLTELYADANGPHASFFTSGNGNKLAANTALSTPAVQAMLNLFADQRDADDNPIVITESFLVIPPHLEVTARNILDALQIELTENGGTSNQKLIARNWMAGKLKLIINPWLPIVSTTNGKTSWYIFASSGGSSRPAMVYATLRGRETPQMMMKAPNSINLGGGDVSVMEGDFDIDAIDYKVRHFFGATRIDPKMAVASNGSGTPD